MHHKEKVVTACGHLGSSEHRCMDLGAEAAPKPEPLCKVAFYLERQRAPFCEK